jgi:hypothetical protein
MTLFGVGAALVIMGVVIAAMRTLRRGRLSEPGAAAPESPRDTLEPSGSGRRLSLRADLPGIALVVIGGILLLIGAVTNAG